MAYVTQRPWSWRDHFGVVGEDLPAEIPESVTAALLNSGHIVAVVDPKNTAKSGE